MKNKISVLVLIGFLTFTGFSIASTTNYSNPENDSCCCCIRSCKKMCVLSCEDVEMNVENVKDGVVVKLTSKNEEVVKKVQEMCAKMKEKCTQEDCCKEEGSKKNKVKK